MNVTRITSTHAQKVPFLFFLLCLAMFGKGAKESCGTYPERVKEELLRSKLNVERRELERVFRKLGGLAAIEEVKGAARDIGNIAVIEEDAGLISRRNLFNLNQKTLRFVPVAGGYGVELAAIDAGGALASRIAGLREIAARLAGRASITLDPTERHGFEYQSWFGFTLFAEGVRGSLGRGGTYRIAREDGEGEVATGFSLYPDDLVETLGDETARDLLVLPPGHDRAVAARLRAIGWRTLAALDEGDDAVVLGCTHLLAGIDPIKL